MSNKYPITGGVQEPDLLTLKAGLAQNGEVGDLLRQIESVLFPRNCAQCGAALAGAAQAQTWNYLCEDCARELCAVGQEACVRCGAAVYGVIAGERLCSVCRESPPPWGRARSLLRYRGAAREWVRDYKYADARWVEREWRKLFEARQFVWLKEYLGDAWIIPVPLHPLKKFLRGFNQAEELAKALLQSAGGSREQLHTNILRRKRWTPPQARLRREKRQRNVQGAFALRTDFKPEGLQRQRLVLVDDLLTTGATLSACTQALKRAGFRQVDILTLARA